MAPAEPRAAAPRPKPPRPLQCQAGSDNCRAAAGRIVYVERVDPDGDGDAHFVLVSRESITGPGISVIDVRRDLRPSPCPARATGSARSVRSTRARTASTRSRPSVSASSAGTDLAQLDGAVRSEQHRQPRARIARGGSLLAQHHRRPRAAGVQLRSDLLGKFPRYPADLTAPARRVNGDRVRVVLVARIATQLEHGARLQLARGQRLAVKARGSGDCPPHAARARRAPARRGRCSCR